MKKIITLLFLIMCSFKSFSTNNIICHDCYSQNDFYSVAMAQPMGTVIIVNPEADVAYSWFIVIEPLDGKMLTPSPVPQAVWDAMDKYNDTISAHANSEFVVGGLPSQNFSPDACGTGMYNGPDFPYRDACSTHDQCYASNTSKAVCDEAFYEDMLAIRDKIAPDSDVYEQWLLRSYYTTLLEAFYLAVQTQASVNAYCNATTNNTASECIVQQPQPPGGVRSGDITGSGSSSRGGTYLFKCELWRFTDGNGGYYYMNRNCKMVSYTP